jgi:23S rRNA pseudouridine2605 synthase
MRTNKSHRELHNKTQASFKNEKNITSLSVITQKLHKLLAQAGFGSRREMEKLITAGQVTINKRVAKIGDRASNIDVVRIKERIIHLNFGNALPRVLLYHKPEGEIVSHNDPHNRPSVFDKLPKIRASKWISIGRLDFNTCGLLIFTTDGVLANRLMHPRYEVEREYAVRIVGQLSSSQIKLLTTGIELDDGAAKFISLVDQGGKGSNHWYHVILKEGRNREIRRMFETIGITISRLIRVRFGSIKLPPRLRRGKSIELNKEEVERLFSNYPNN